MYRWVVHDTARLSSGAESCINSGFNQRLHGVWLHGREFGAVMKEDGLEKAVSVEGWAVKNLGGGGVYTG